MLNIIKPSQNGFMKGKPCTCTFEDSTGSVKRKPVERVIEPYSVESGSSATLVHADQDAPAKLIPFSPGAVLQAAAPNGWIRP